MAAIWFLTVVTMERAWVVFCISKGKQNRMTKARTMMVSIGIWIAALSTSAAPLLGWNNYVYEVRHYFSTLILITSVPRDTSSPVL